ncbi:MAG: hypothetical protein Q9225_006836 [Loekoesia sp. 1 TL-2023]
MAGSNTTASNPDLWSLARDQLSEADRHSLGPSGGSGLEIVKDIQSLNEQAVKDSISKRWRIVVPGKAGKTIIIRDLLGKVTKWLDIFAKVGDAAMQYDPTHAALPWAGIAINDIENFGFVLEGTELIARVTSRSAILENLYLGGAYQTTDNLRQELYHRQNSLKRVIKSVFITKESFEELLKSIKSSESTVDRCSSLINTETHNNIALSVQQLSITSQDNHKQMLELLRKIDEPIIRIGRSLAAIEDSLEQSKRLKILNWISTQPYNSYHRQVFKGVLSGTGAWLLNDPNFVLWQNESASSLLWLHGSHGTGKSKLVSIVIADALRKFEDGLAPSPAYYYCSRNAAEPERSNPDVILASIARQLACPQPDCPLLRPAVDKFEAERLTGSLRKSLDLDESRELILQLVEYYDMTTIVIDALDECDTKTRYELLYALQTILQDAKSLVKIFVSSRDDGDIKWKLQGFPNLTIESGKNFHDISAFVRSETEQLIRWGKLLRHSRSKDDLRELIITKVIKKADGMFRWASMQLQYLCGAVLDEDLREMLGKLPLELSDLYSEIHDRMLANQGSAGTAIIQNSIKWLLSSQIRLNSSEFRRAISMNINISLDGLSNEQILELLHNFVILDRDLDVFRFAHLSVAEYLQESRLEYKEELCNALAAEICLIEMIGTSSCAHVGNFFHHSDLDARHPASTTREPYSEELSFYALRMWASHSAWGGEEQRTVDGRFKEVF